jgi:thiol-disulfide isomerase/thioredoxin
MSDMIEQERNGSGFPRGLFSRPLVWITFLALLAFLSFGFLGQFFFRVKTANPFPARDYFKRLAIERPKAVIQAPNFTLEDLSGKPLSIKDFKGKVVFLNFWATWCVPCREEMPLMEILHREYKDQGMEMVAVNFREDKKEVRKFFAELGLSFKSLMDSGGDVSDKYGAWSLPLTYIIDRKGEFVGKTVGDRKWDSEDAREFFRELLEAKN